MRKFLFALVVLIVLASANLCFANVEVATKSISRGDSVDVKYPAVLNLEDKKLQKKINAEIEKTIRDLIKKERASDTPKTITATYKVTYNAMDTLSVKMTFTIMPERGAYPTNIIKGFNYDMLTGELLRYGFMQSVSLEDVNKALMQHLRKNNIEIAGFGGIDFVPSDFYIDEQGELVSIIQDQVIAPHAVGPIEFKVF